MKLDPERKEVWIAAFASFCQIWPFMEGTPERILVYDAALADLSLGEIRDACRWVIECYSGHQQPTPGLLRDAARGPIEKAPVYHHLDQRFLRHERKRGDPLIATELHERVTRDRALPEPTASPRHSELPADLLERLSTFGTP